jgi:hypothetical protein
VKQADKTPLALSCFLGESTIHKSAQWLPREGRESLRRVGVQAGAGDFAIL